VIRVKNLLTTQLVLDNSYTMCLKNNSPLLPGGASYYAVEHCSILIIFGRRIPKRCWLK